MGHTSERQRPRVAVVGGGRWGWNHVRNLYDMGCLAAVVDTHADILDRVTEELSGVEAIPDLPSLIESDIPAVVVATPATTHAQIAIDLLAQGKHVLVEKPFALTVEDAEAMIATANASGVTLMAGHLLLYQPAVVWIKDFLKSGALGRVATFYQDRLNLGTVRVAENALWSLGVHDVASLVHLTGAEPTRIAIWGQAIIQPGVQDDMHLHMEFEGGAAAHIHNSWLWPERRRRLSIVGTEAMLVYDELDQTVRLLRRRVNSDLSVQDDGSEVLFRGDSQPLRFELEHFLDRIEERQEPWESPEDALSVVRILVEADRQMRRVTESDVR